MLHFRRYRCKMAVFVVAVVCVIFVHIFKYTFDQIPDKTVGAYQLPLESYGLAPAEKLTRTIPNSRTWPILQGYEDWAATADSSPPDPLLLRRITLADEMAKRPLVRIRKTERRSSAIRGNSSASSTNRGSTKTFRVERRRG